MLNLWEILVPTEMVRTIDGKDEVRPISVRYHRIWDEKVRAITNGLTIFPPTKGQWKSPSGTLFIERMIPVRIACNRDDIMEIAKMTMKYYNQEAVLVYLISQEVILLQKDNPFSHYDKKFGDNKPCSDCGHPYSRHFDSYENWAPVGCKYCGCMEFKI